MTDITFEQKHPRGEAGKFTTKEGTPAEVGLEGILGFRGPEHSPRADTLWRGDTFDLGYGEADDEESARILKWVETEGVTAKGEYLGHGPYVREDGDMTRHSAHNYLVNISTADGRTLEVPVHTGSPVAPTTTEVLQGIAYQAWSYEGNSKEDYLRDYAAIDYGFDEVQDGIGDSMYSSAQEQVDALRDFAGEDYDHLLYGRSGV